MFTIARSFRALSESLITPLELKMEEWKKVASQLDKDHAKGRPVCSARTGTTAHFPQLTNYSFSIFKNTRKPEQTSRKSHQTPSNCRRRLRKVSSLK